MPARSDRPGEILRPLDSLRSKSAKALGKLTPGTWQHTRLEENLTALELAWDLLHGRTPDPASEERFERARVRLVAMIGQTADMLEKFPPGTAQHTLQKNRLAALREAEVRLRAEARGGG